MKKRETYLDYLRVWATIAVVVLHISAQNWDLLDGRGFDWFAVNVYETLVRWAVPVFVMISGALFLSKETTTKTIYTHYIMRLVVTYLVWSAFYAVYGPVGNLLTNSEYVISFKSILLSFISGPFHMWFIPMIIGLYMCIPIFKQMIKSKEIVKYYLILSLVFAFLLPELFNIGKEFGGTIADVVMAFKGVVSYMYLYPFMGFAYYYILGYVLSCVELSKKQEKLLYVAGVIGFVMTFVLSAWVGWKNNSPVVSYYDPFNINIVFMAIGVFVWFRNREYKCEKFNLIISKLSKYSFGMFLSHVFVMEVLGKLGLDNRTFGLVISIPIVSILTVIGAFCISFVLNMGARFMKKRGLDGKRK